MTEAWLEARALTRVYGRRTVVRDVSFRVEAGELWCVLGPNGSGKSTLLKLLAGLLRPTSGESELSVNSVGMKGPERRRHLGLVSPEISPYEELHAVENMEFAARMRNLPRGAARHLDLLERVGLTDAAHRPVGGYSSGMRQRLKLAIAIQHEPALLILDEPMALLDEGGRSLVRAVVGEQLKRGVVLWATNDPSELPAERNEIRLPGA